MARNAITPLEELFGLRGRIGVVTGASAGLGLEFADALASAGADVALVARRRERLEEAAAQLSRKYGVRALPVAVDITDHQALSTAFERVGSELGGVDILVNSAGLAPTGKAEKQWPDDWRRTIDLNLSALFHCCLLGAAAMRQRGGGRVINIASIFGHQGSSLFRVAAYAASKGGVENLTRQLAVEWASDGITVNAIAPAWFASEMTAGSLDRQSIVDRMGDAAMLKRMGRAGELKTACLFLAAPASSYVTGAVIPVDGGYSSW
jgi:gluconate 5-dehydrogenase